MSRTTLGALFSDARGKVGGVVLSKWRGINTVRSRVTPANPQTAAQTAQRDAMTIVVKSWQGLIAAVKSLWNTKASGKAKSGFNIFTSENVAQEVTNDYLKITPDAPDVDNISTFAAATGVASGDIDLSWLQGDLAAGDVLKICYRKTEDGTIAWAADSTAGALAVTLSGLTAATEYIVYAFGIDAAGDYASTLSSVATSQA